MVTKHNNTKHPETLEDVVNRKVLPIDVVSTNTETPPVSPAIKAVLDSVKKQLTSKKIP